jgi:hypothetical protein
MSELTFGRCNKCGEHVSGHAVYVDGILWCSYCELDKRHKTFEEILREISLGEPPYSLPKSEMQEANNTKALPDI